MRWFVATIAGLIIGGAISAGLLIGWQAELSPPLTGDRASDRACAAAFEGFRTDSGKAEKSQIFAMSPDARRAYVDAVAQYSRESTIPAIEDAGDELVIAGSMDGSLFGTLTWVKAIGDMAKACASHGWNAKDAGLWSE